MSRTFVDVLWMAKARSPANGTITAGGLAQERVINIVVMMYLGWRYHQGE